MLVLAAGVWVDGNGFPLPRWDSGVTIHAPSNRDSLVSLPHQGRSVSVSRFNVVDGDTLRVGGETFRLHGYNTPETGREARCAHERDLADRAATRLRSLIGAAGTAALTPIACACRPGTEGTSECNYGRSCGSLQVDGRDVGSILISEGLARPYACGPTGCPRRHRWC